MSMGLVSQTRPDIPQNSNTRLKIILWISKKQEKKVNWAREVSSTFLEEKAMGQGKLDVLLPCLLPKQMLTENEEKLWDHIWFGPYMVAMCNYIASRQVPHSIKDICSHQACFNYVFEVPYVCARRDLLDCTLSSTNLRHFLQGEILLLARPILSTCACEQCNLQKMSRPSHSD